MSDEWKPDDEDVEDYFAVGAVEYQVGEGSVSISEAHDAYHAWLADHDRALREEITREVRADMFRGVRAWVKRFTPGDRWDPQDAHDLESALLGIVEANPDRSRAREEETA